MCVCMWVCCVVIEANDVDMCVCVCVWVGVLCSY